MRLHSQMTVTQRLLRALFEELEIRLDLISPIFVKKSVAFFYAEIINHFFPQKNNYIGFLDFKKVAIKKLGMRANTCSFNPGVIIANLTEWKNQNITQQLEHWMELNTQYVYILVKRGDHLRNCVLIEITC